jgi:hypothetical protein
MTDAALGLGDCAVLYLGWPASALDVSSHQPDPPPYRAHKIPLDRWAGQRLITYVRPLQARLA